jgi:hypothetical protein
MLNGEMLSAAFCPSGQRVFSLARDLVRAFDATGGREVYPEQGFEYCGVTGDRRCISAQGSAGVGGISQPLQWPKPVDRRWTLAMVRPGRAVLEQGPRLLVASGEALFLINTGLQILWEARLRAPVTFCAWSPCGQRCLASGADGRVLILAAESGEQQLEFIHDGPVLTAFFNASGDRVLCTGDREAFSFDLEGRVTATFRAPTWRLKTGAWSPSARRCLFVGDESVFLIDVAKRQTLEFEGRFDSAVLSPDEDMLLLANSDQIHLYSGAGKALRWAKDLNADPAGKVDFEAYYSKTMLSRLGYRHREGAHDPRLSSIEAIIQRLASEAPGASHGAPLWPPSAAPQPLLILGHGGHGDDGRLDYLKSPRIGLLVDHKDGGDALTFIAENLLLTPEEHRAGLWEPWVRAGKATAFSTYSLPIRNWGDLPHVIVKRWAEEMPADAGSIGRRSVPLDAERARARRRESAKLEPSDAPGELPPDAELMKSRLHQEADELARRIEILALAVESLGRPTQFTTKKE